MLSQILEQLEKLQAELSYVDPANETNAADAVADIAVKMRNLLRNAENRRAPRVKTPRHRRAA